MENAVQEIVPESGKRAMDMGLLPATMAELSGQGGAAVQACSRTTVMLAGLRLDRARHESARHGFADSLDSRFHLAP
ncbi:hypothetical protein [Sphingomonas parva]|uniref:hypothetical protein n=1 Tax=Sphingomonas parva TaxID=2555898 RepID=UPI002989B449|nr:hypothetical protein [Sphingomonas parva]